MAESHIHVFNQGDYSTHRLVTIPPTQLQPLASSSLRLKTRVLGLTTNNLTYANLGFALGWWDVYPIPTTAPAPYSDRAAYATVAGWGYAEVLESSIADIAPGASIYGYVNVTDGTWDVSVKPCEGLEGTRQYLVTDAHRQHLWTVYNRISVCAPLAQISSERKGWDALMNPLFGTGFNLSTFGFAWEDEKRVHPSGEGAWTTEDARLSGSVVVVLNASGKTGMAFAWALRHARPADQQPLRIVGVGSERSVGMIERSGVYDDVLLNQDAGRVSQILKDAAGKVERVVLLDFGARPGVLGDFTAQLEGIDVRSTRLFVGGDNRPMGPGQLMEARQKRGEGVQVNANVLREKGIEVGGREYFVEYEKAWGGFVARGGVKGVDLVWKEGMEEWERGWEALCKDEVRGEHGMVYAL